MLNGLQSVKIKWMSVRILLLSFLALVDLNSECVILELDSHTHTPVSELAEPDEGLGILHLLLNQLGHHVTCMDIDGTDGHDLLAVTFGQLAKQVGDQSV